MEPTGNDTETSPLVAVPVDQAPAEPERGCFELDLACFCCSLQQGAKILLILAIVEGVMVCMSVGSIGAFTLPVFVLGVATIMTSLYGFWGVQKEDTTKLTIIGWSFFLISLAVMASTVGRLFEANKYCDVTACTGDEEIYEDEFGDTFTCQERADAEKNSCIHAHYVNAILVCATTFPTAAFLVLLMRSLVLKHDRGESIPEGALSDLDDEIMGDSAQNHQALGTQSAGTSVMGRPVVAGKQLWALPFFKTKLRAPVNNVSKEAATLPKKDNFV